MITGERGARVRASASQLVPALAVFSHVQGEGAVLGPSQRTVCPNNKSAVMTCKHSYLWPGSFPGEATLAAEMIFSFFFFFFHMI